MSYVRAEEILPKELIKAIQRYVSGRSIYIPCRVYAQLDAVKEIYRDPQKYEGTKLRHEVDVALRELALEKVRKEPANKKSSPK